MLGREVVFKHTQIIDMYDKVQQIKNIIQKQKMFIISTEEYGRVCFSTKSKWAKTLEVGDHVDIQLMLNAFGKNIILAKRPKLLRIY